jgi:hypothetical protein
MENLMKRILGFIILVLFTLPGIYFGVAGGHDPFAAMAVVVMSFILAAISGYTMAYVVHARARYQEFKAAKKNIPESMKTTILVALGGWVVTVIAGFVLAGTSGFGVAIYGSAIGLLDRKLRGETFDEAIDQMLNDKPAEIKAE